MLSQDGGLLFFFLFFRCFIINVAFMRPICSHQNWSNEIEKSPAIVIVTCYGIMQDEGSEWQEGVVNGMDKNYLSMHKYMRVSCLYVSMYQSIDAVCLFNEGNACSMCLNIACTFPHELHIVSMGLSFALGCRKGKMWAKRELPHNLCKQGISYIPSTLFIKKILEVSGQNGLTTRRWLIFEM